jgi:hypothetical protein
MIFFYLKTMLFDPNYLSFITVIGDNGKTVLLGKTDDKDGKKKWVHLFKDKSCLISLCPTDPIIREVLVEKFTGILPMKADELRLIKVNDKKIGPNKFLKVLIFQLNRDDLEISDFDFNLLHDENPGGEFGQRTSQSDEILRSFEITTPMRFPEGERACAQVIAGLENVECSS